MPGTFHVSSLALYRLNLAVKASEVSAFAGEMNPVAVLSCIFRDFQTWRYGNPGLNTPQIGFYHVCGADNSVLRGTEFADYESVFHDAWNHILNAIATANRYHIGVLLGKTRSFTDALLFSSRSSDRISRLACGPREAGTYRSQRCQPEEH